ncbi:MAG: helix-turn-helix transcriptional regulator [Kiritimatiellae bacterium]|nr:helix-turn-helix transcriptional regulator [Kiritimatiellia bacterium]
MTGKLTTSKEIGAFVREKRREQGVTQAQLAGVANTGLRFVSDLENGKGTVQLRKLLAVLDALGYGLYIGNRWEK